MKNRLVSLLLLALFLACPGWSNPAGGVIVSGSATIGSTPTTTTITQASNQLIVNWNSFSIGSAETTNFVQPSANSVALNRVLGGTESSILGTLHSNGSIFLLNPNGIVFGPNATVNVGGVLASTLSMSDSNFLSRNYSLTQDPGSPLRAVINQGTISANPGETILLLAPFVANFGTIQSPGGNVSMGAGQQALVTFPGGLISMPAPSGTLFKDVILNPDQVDAALQHLVGDPIAMPTSKLVANPDGTYTLTSGEGVAATGLNSSEATAIHPDGSISCSANYCVTTISVDGNGSMPGGTFRMNSDQTSILGSASLVSALGGGSGWNVMSGTIDLSSYGNVVFQGPALIGNGSGINNSSTPTSQVQVPGGMGTVNITAGNSILFAPFQPALYGWEALGEDLTITAAAANLSAKNAIGDLPGGNYIQMNVQQLNSTSKSLYAVIYGGPLWVGKITADTVSLWAYCADPACTNGEIYQGYQQGSGISAKSVTLYGENGIGTLRSPLIVSANSLSAEVSQIGGLYIKDPSTAPLYLAPTLGDSLENTGGDIRLTTGGDMILEGWVVAPNVGQRITLTSGGSILADTADNLVNAGYIKMTAKRGIGSLATPVNVMPWANSGFFFGNAYLAVTDKGGAIFVATNPHLGKIHYLSSPHTETDLPFCESSTLPCP